jgi:hypothetical protein
VNRRYKPEYLEALRLFNDGFFWEAHEVLERIWAPLPRGDVEKTFYQGLILVAVAFHQRARAASEPDRFAAPALRCYRSALAKFDAVPARFLGLDLGRLRGALAPCFEGFESPASTARLLPAPPRLVVDLSCESSA